MLHSASSPTSNNIEEQQEQEQEQEQQRSSSASRSSAQMVSISNPCLDDAVTPCPVLNPREMENRRASEKTSRQTEAARARKQAAARTADQCVEASLGRASSARAELARRSRASCTGSKQNKRAKAANQGRVSIGEGARKNGALSLARPTNQGTRLSRSSRCRLSS